jgi:tetratricopeptide (TPR) repeat protein
MGMGESIDAGRPDLALDQYERALYWSKAAMPTFEAAVAAFRLGKWEQAFRYAAYAQDMTPDLALKEQVRDLMKSIPPGDITTAVCPLPEKVFLPSITCPSQVEAGVDEH